MSVRRLRLLKCADQADVTVARSAAEPEPTFRYLPHISARRVEASRRCLMDKEDSPAEDNGADCTTNFPSEFNVTVFKGT